MTLEAIYDTRRKIIPIIYNMENHGVTANRKRLDDLYGKYTQESEDLGRRCEDIATSYNYDLVLPKGSGNNDSLREFVFDVMALPVVKESEETGNPSFDKYVLDHYEATLEIDTAPHDFVTSLRAKRKRDTARQYMDGYRKYWHPLILEEQSQTCTGGDGASLVPDPGNTDWYVLHPSLNPTGTATLRWSSSNPNEQNISKQGMYEGDTANLRYCFGPAPGREWWSLDAKNIELRIPAYESKEQELIDLFERPDEPPYYGSNHLLIFHTLHPDKWAEVEKEVGFEKVGPACKKKYASTWYQWVKNGNFAVQYGAVDRDDGLGTADIAYHMPGAQSIIKSRFTKQEALNQKWISYANRTGYVETLPDTTVDLSRGYPILCTRTPYGAIKPTVPLNYHVQSTAMWWMMMSMIRCYDLLQDWNRLVRHNLARLGYFMVMQVHDELVFDFPKRAHPKKNPRQSNLGRIMEIASMMSTNGDNLSPRIPTPVGIEYHENNWSEGIAL
jgi:DNA polymerase I-like protein with 3'-5' exonuclease and polymerase domains